MKKYLTKADILSAKKSKKSKANQLLKLGSIVLERAGWTKDHLVKTKRNILAYAESITMRNAADKEVRKTFETIASDNAKCFCGVGAAIRAGLEANLSYGELVTTLNDSKFAEVEEFNDSAAVTKDDVIRYMRNQAR